MDCSDFSLPRKLLLDISDELWAKFKLTVPRDKTLNDAVVELIQREVDRRKKET